jgi:hypothetical protein
MIESGMRIYLAGILTLAALVGCGGGGGGQTAGDPQGGGDTGTFGGFSTRGFTNQEPVIANTNNVSSVGLAGSFSLVQYRPTDLTKDPLAVFVRRSSIFSSGGDFSNPFLQSIPSNLYPLKVKWSPNVDRIYFVAFDNYTGQYNLYWTKPFSASTSNLIQPFCQDFDVDPSGNFIYYINASGPRDVWRCNSSGGADVDLTNSAADENLVSMGDADTLILQEGNSIILWNLPSNSQAGGLFLSDNIQRICGFKNGLALAYVSASSTKLSISDVATGYVGFGRPIPLPPGETNFGVIAGSQDGKTLYDFGGNTFAFDVASSTWTKIFTTQDGTYAPTAGDFSLSPKLTTIAGSGGVSNPTGTSGIILSSVANSHFGSIVSIDASTRSTGVMTTQTPSGAGSPYLVFVFECDKIAKLGYSTYAPEVFTQIIGSPGTLNGVVVSIDGTTGKVASLVTYTVSRGPKPKVTANASGVTIDGDLDGVYDSLGKQVGRQAHTMTLDSAGRISTH